ncbi:hypothetical protein CVT25_004149 [Psilocybe cyanescens]|uniref:Hydrophobin n=1 Tax=Psilocybe cyanescens TaxID=93625 RepID=A0A409XKT9_PSICY|nr:hypothetical protein CVT25_004149 [Psilocybe cyanescens]
MSTAFTALVLLLIVAAASRRAAKQSPLVIPIPHLRKEKHPISSCEEAGGSLSCCVNVDSVNDLSSSLRSKVASLIQGIFSPKTV